MFRHNSVPVGIGAKHSNVAHKAHCMYHAVYLETGTRELLSCFLGKDECQYNKLKHSTFAVIECMVRITSDMSVVVALLTQIALPS
jgi:hypothetical protein